LIKEVHKLGVELDLNGRRSTIRLAKMGAPCEGSQIMNQLELGVLGSGSERLVGSRKWFVVCGVQLKYY
jgi:hypothetical protein